MYLSWAMFCEGSSDRAYLNILLPRVMQELLLREGVRTITVPAEAALPLGTRGREVEKVAQEICESQNAFHLLFIHADMGGRELSRTANDRSTSYCTRANELCGWEMNRCVVVTPRHEMEAWALADPQAVADALGFRGPIDSLNLPINASTAEKIADPKSVLDAAYRTVAGRRASRGANQALPAIARNQRLSALRNSSSFREFEIYLRRALQSLGCIRIDH